MKYLLLLLSASMLPLCSPPARAGDDPIATARAKQGFEVSPIPRNELNLKGADPEMVGLGSYIVNGAACSGCHSLPQFLPSGDAAGNNPAAGDPFLGTPGTQHLHRQLLANVNVSHFMGGGRCFGPFMARNIAPDAHGLPEGLTKVEFTKAMRTGEDIHCNKDPSDPICALGPPTSVLQVMPWPQYHGLVDADLDAVYAYLKALPPAAACNTVADGCPGFSGAAARSASYVYANTADCPNPAPPQ